MVKVIKAPADWACPSVAESTERDRRAPLMAGRGWGAGWRWGHLGLIQILMQPVEHAPPHPVSKQPPSAAAEVSH